MRTAFGGICCLILGAGAALAMPVDMTVDRLLNICEAHTVEAASAKGDELGWKRFEAPEWRASFIAYNGSSVDVVSWRRELANKDETLSFWIAVGPNAHRACAYSTTDPASVFDELSKRLGKPDILESFEAAEMTSAWWTQAGREVSFSKVGSSAMIAIGPSL